MHNLLEQLNPEQRLAAETTEGPVLILAGAGTGKTRAITFRMANLIAKGTPAESVLAVTFTNKAAEEMQNRVTDLLLRAGVPPARPWISTFHSLCVRLLRREAVHTGLARDFAIYDDDDQLSAVKLAMSKLRIDEEALTPRNVLSRISYAKNHGQSPEQMRAEAFAADTRKVAEFSRPTKQCCSKATPSILTTFCSDQRACCAIPRACAKNGGRAFPTSMWMNTRTRTAYSTTFCVC